MAAPPRTEPPPLRPPRARQGPGPLPHGLISSLDLVIARRAAGALPGDRRAAGLGSGTELAQLRPYEVGDDVRQIDAAATARTGVPHVRLHVPERTLTTWIVLDVSPSMAFGTAQRLKWDVAEGAALVLGRLAVRRAGSLALMTFGAGRPRLLPPRASKPAVVALRRALAEGVAPDGRPDRHALADALRRTGKVATQAGLVVLISDFRDQDDWTRPLGALRARHSVLAIEIGDPRESQIPAVGRLSLVDPETGQRVEVDTSRRRVRERFAQLEAERRALVTRELRRLEVEHVALSTDGDWLGELGEAAALMSFADPLLLFALLLVPVALLAHLASRRRAQRYAVRFPAVSTLVLAAGRTPAWRRHLPIVLLLTALAALALALAKPQRTVAVPIERASIMMVTDHSRSMMAEDVDPTRLTAAKKAAHTFLDQLPHGIRVGVTTFADVPDGTQTPTRDHSLVRRIVDAQIADGGTATGDALQIALDTLEREPRGADDKRPPSAIVLLSDGATTTGRDPVLVAEAARAMRVPIYTVALGTRDATVPNPGFGPPTLSVAPDPETLRRIAEASGGRAYSAQDDQQLSSIYQTLGSQLGTHDVKREVTAAFAVGGLILLLGAAAASTHWAGRLP